MHTKTRWEIREACQDFLANWDKKSWIARHGGAPGLIDPDGVSDDAEPCDVEALLEAWDCIEYYWCAYRYDNDLYLRWVLNPYPRSARIPRDLWVQVESDFFPEETE